MFMNICGLDGASKSTSIQTIKNVFESRGQYLMCLREPGGTPMAESIRTVHKSTWGDEVVDTDTEMFLMFASRNQLYRNLSDKFMSEGVATIHDRSWWCTYAYQVHDIMTDEDATLFWTLCRRVCGETPFDASLYLDVEPKIGLARSRGRGALDRIEEKDIAFFERARKGYQHLVENQPNSVMIDANGDLDSVQREVKAWAHTMVDLYEKEVALR